MLLLPDSPMPIDNVQMQSALDTILDPMPAEARILVLDSLLGDLSEVNSYLSRKRLIDPLVMQLDPSLKTQVVNAIFEKQQAVNALSPICPKVSESESESEIADSLSFYLREFLLSTQEKYLTHKKLEAQLATLTPLHTLSVAADQAHYAKESEYCEKEAKPWSDLPSYSLAISKTQKVREKQAIDNLLHMAQFFYDTKLNYYDKILAKLPTSPSPAQAADAQAHEQTPEAPKSERTPEALKLDLLIALQKKMDGPISPFIRKSQCDKWIDFLEKAKKTSVGLEPSILEDSIKKLKACKHIKQQNVNLMTNLRNYIKNSRMLLRSKDPNSNTTGILCNNDHSIRKQIRGRQKDSCAVSRI